jgi:competence protein ComEC
VSDPPPRRPTPPAWRDFARAPLVPVAVAATAGLVADRYLETPLAAGLVAAAGGVVGWAVALARRSSIALPLLWAAFAGLAAAYHHTHRHGFPPDDIGEVASEEPALANLRGVILDEPAARPAPKADPLAPRQTDRDTTTLRVTELADGGTWRPASGKVTLSVERVSGPPLGGIHAGDAVEVIGTLSRPRPPGNPGEQDYASYLLDQRVRAEVRVSDSAATVVRLDATADPFAAWVAAARGRAAAALTSTLPPREAAVARALLLGDTAAMGREEWDIYVRTGVVHALAVSGQHLLVLAGFAWVVLRLAGVRRARGAWAVALLMVGYAVLTGLRPSGVRAAVMVVAACGAFVLRRPLLPANAFAAGWLAVVLLNPADPFTLGCQLSFLSVFALVWGAGRWFTPKPLTPLEELIEESRPVWEKAIRGGGRAVFAAYGVTLLLMLANGPLLAAGVNLVSPVGVLVGPPLVLLTSVALVSGFLLILVAPLGPVAALPAWVTTQSLAAAGWLARRAADLPGGSVYTPGPPAWWLVGFYALVAAAILLDTRRRNRLAVALLGWALLGLVRPTATVDPSELRVTFLSVGHGGCTVLECPDGRCLLYDAGTTVGPAMMRRVVAPYLWHRGINRIDELFVSHADTDHFNGVAALLERFPVGRAMLTPSFADKPTHEVAAALNAFDRHRVPVRVAVAGDRFDAGEVTLDVLHPPDVGPPGAENERSLVLAVGHAGHTILLTGDLEKAGTARVVGLAPLSVDVMMAPHHGSRAALPRELLDWCRPRFVVVSRGAEKGNTVTVADARPAALWDTWGRGAVTVRSHPTGVTAEAFRTGERVVVGRGK